MFSTYERPVWDYSRRMNCIAEDTSIDSGEAAGRSSMFGHVAVATLSVALAFGLIGLLASQPHDPDEAGQPEVPRVRPTPAPTRVADSLGPMMAVDNSAYLFIVGSEEQYGLLLDHLALESSVRRESGEPPRLAWVALVASDEDEQRLLESVAADNASSATAGGLYVRAISLRPAPKP